jgi:hypothetical protein
MYKVNSQRSEDMEIFVNTTLNTTYSCGPRGYQFNREEANER